MQKIAYISVDLLKHHPENPRLIKDKNFEKLCESIKANTDYFETRPILCNPDHVVFAGNMRLRAAKEVGMKEVPCAIMDIPVERQRELMIRDNTQNGEYDPQILTSFFGEAELEKWGVDLGQFGVWDEPKEEKTPAARDKSISIKVVFKTLPELEAALPEIEIISARFSGSTISVNKGNE